ncbi:hypothetical protein WJU16_12370 [Chitinophaga pollutisoli]|uniref:Uncharacterized protein n=1 Tax=Chitinophaga pollutisoli TaxID=3133966 RepID=A0ABZ2YWQ9_9BACT
MGNFRNWLSSNMLFRNILADFGSRSAYTGEPGGFIAYFQYKIGPYQQDYHLYFPKEPFAVRYNNEVFNKLFEYTGEDIYKYLDFHFDAFPEKNTFILYLDRQLTERLKKSSSKERRIKLESAADWVAEKKQLFRADAELTREDISRDLQLVIDSKAAGKAEEAQQRLDNLTDKLEHKFDDAIARLESATNLLPTGSISLNNKNHEDKLVQLLYIIQHLNNPKNRTEALFSGFSNINLAAILRHHFQDFSDKKPNTVEKNAKASIAKLKNNDPKVQKLIQALEEFFYG